MYLFSKLLLCFFLGLFVASAHAQNVHGVLRVVKGEVQVKNAKGETAKARIGGKVFPKDVIITGKDARAKIVMVDNNEINVSPESQIEIQHYEYDPAGGKKDVLLNVIYGKVRSKVEQKYDGKTSKFQIKTPGAVAGVRGTDFLMGFNRADSSSRVVTFEGKVDFGTPGPGGAIMNPVSVAPGMTAAVNASGSAPSAPAPMPKEELAKMDVETKSDAPKGQGPNAPGNDQRAPAADEKKEGGKGDGAGAGGPGPGGVAAGSDGGTVSSDASANSSGGEKSAESPARGSEPKEKGPGSPGPKPDMVAGPPAGGAGSGMRAPASEGNGCEMCGGSGGPGGNILPPPIVKPPIMPPSFTPPQPPRVECGQQCVDGIKGGKTNLIIKVK